MNQQLAQQIQLFLEEQKTFTVDQRTMTHMVVGRVCVCLSRVSKAYFLRDYSDLYQKLYHTLEDLKSPAKEELDCLDLTLSDVISHVGGNNKEAQGSRHPFMTLLLMHIVGATQATLADMAKGGEIPKLSSLADYDAFESCIDIQTAIMTSVLSYVADEIITLFSDKYGKQEQAELRQFILGLGAEPVVEYEEQAYLLQDNTDEADAMASDANWVFEAMKDASDNIYAEDEMLHERPVEPDYDYLPSREELDDYYYDRMASILYYEIEDVSAELDSLLSMLERWLEQAAIYIKKHSRRNPRLDNAFFLTFHMLELFPSFYETNSLWAADGHYERRFRVLLRKAASLFVASANPQRIRRRRLAVELFDELLSDEFYAKGLFGGKPLIRLSVYKDNIDVYYVSKDDDDKEE